MLRHNPYFIFWKSRFQMGRNTVRIHGWRRWVELSVSVLIVIAMTWGATTLFTVGFGFLYRQGELGSVLLDRVYSLGWSVIFYLLVISNLITAMSTLYKNRDVQFLWTTRIPDRTLFRLKAIDNLIYSSWAVMILGLPLTIAYGTIRNMSILEICAILFLGLLPFLMIASSLAQGLLLVLVRISKWIRLRTGFIIILIVAGFIFWIARKYNQTNIIVAGEIPSTRYLTRYLSNLGRTPFVFLPSYWFSRGITGEHVLPFFTLLGSTALITWEFLGWLAEKHYYLSWQTYMTQGSPRVHRKSQVTSRHTVRKRSLPRALILKDWRQFVRSPQQWIQFLLFMVLITVYLVNLSRVNYTVTRFEGLWDRIVFLLNFGFSGFILASLITRFVFPLISLEGRMRWILFTSPATIKQVYSIKFKISAILFFGIAQWVALWSNIFLSMGWQVQVISTLYLLIMSVTLTAVSLGLGAVFPQFDEANPMRIVSGIGGIIAIVVSLIYVALVVLSLVSLYSGLLIQSRPVTVFFSFGFVLVLSLLCLITFYRLGYRALCRTLQ
ncbi:MAG: hypothetical protein GXO90_11665 [FCB group bacterium]|nr:hypothetical protein [FCB group bacterium]